MSPDPLIARLAAANPFPAPAAPAVLSRQSAPRRRVLLGAAAAAALVPAIAFAATTGDLFGFSAQGQPVSTADTPFSRATGLEQAMTDLDFPSTLQLIATRDGISFYAARRADGHVCFAVDEAPGEPAHKGVGCDLGNPSLPGTPAFPSPDRPIFDFSRFSKGTVLAGFAADGVSAVDLLDADGNVIGSAAVSDNVYAATGLPAGGAALEAVDDQGAAVYERSFDQAP